MVRTSIGALLFTLLGLIGASRVSFATTAGPQVVLGTPAASQRNPALSWDPVEDVYVLVWEDSRLPVNGVDLYAARISPDGTLDDANGIALLEASVLPDNETQPQIVYNPASQVHVIVWTEARFGFGDIFALRFLASSGTVIPSAGVQITSGNDSEGFPSVAPGTQSVLVAYQANLVGGGVRAKARRMNLNLTALDATPFDLVPGDAFSPIVFGVGSTFQTTWESNGDVFGRTLPDFGAIPASPTIVQVATATRGQASVGLGALGLGNVIAVWEDQRDPAQRDIWGRRYTSTLGAIGAEQTISGSPLDQRDPAVAGDASGGLVVWQDRRNGAINFTTYAARVDATGVVRDPEGFQVLVYNANSTEHAIAKGPGGDYLVASVGGVGANARINYRIVRDEVPAGAMTLSGPASVPADGATAAELVFGAAIGASGFEVVDGTQYTVMLSSANVVIGAPDADLARPGHQVRAFNGEVFLSLTSLDHALVDVMVMSVEGTSSGQGMIEFLNVAPTVTGVVVGPPAPTSSQDLTLNYVYADINGDPEGGTSITWTRNSGVESAYNNLTTVPESATRKDDQWRAAVRPRDGLTFGGQTFSNIVIVGNSPPSAIDPNLSPSTNVRTGTPILLRYIYRDPDGDAEGPTVIRWFDRGTEQPTLEGRRDLLAAEVIKGQIWSVRVRPSDGAESGPEVASATVAVINTRPIPDAGPNGIVVERRPYALDAAASSDIDPQDVLSFTWSQVMVGTEPRVQLSSTTSVSPSFLAPSVPGTTFLTFELMANDGDEDAAAADRITVEVEPVADRDRDGLDDEEEALAGTDPDLADTDRDGLSDGEETPNGVDPLDEDSDDDGVRDGAEGQVTRNGNDPMPFVDLDTDTLINALDPDSDGDSIFDGTEIGVRDPLTGGGTSPYVYLGTDSAAGNFVGDADQPTSTNPNDADTDDDTFLDGVEDANHNGRVDSGESDPNDPLSPGIPCGGGQVCPTGFGCGAGDICRPGVDAGVVCTPMAASLECCSGGCSSAGMKVAPICSAQGLTESCPIGAQSCNAGSCSAPAACAQGADGCEDTSCGCRAVPGEAASPLSMILLLGLFRLRRRR